MTDHYEERHPRHEVPEDIIPGKEEIERVKNMKYKNQAGILWTQAIVNCLKLFIMLLIQIRFFYKTFYYM